MYHGERRNTLEKYGIGTDVKMDNITPDPRVVFLDFEASGLSDDSWPIEIGMAWVNEDFSLGSKSQLIRPHESWPAKAWNEDSEAIHHISRELLATAPEAVEVAASVNSFLAGKTLVSDNPSYEVAWLYRLLSLLEQNNVFQDELEVSSGEALRSVVSGFYQCKIQHIMFDLMVDRIGMERSFKWTELTENNSPQTPHKAGPDAMLMAGVWRDAILMANSGMLDK